MDLETLKEFPGFQGVFKAVISSQIKYLIEQLSVHGAAETIVLSVNLSDGTLHQLGSKTAKGFLEDRDEVKSQFLSHCLNHYFCGNGSEKRFAQQGGYLNSLEQPVPQPTSNSDLCGNGSEKRFVQEEGYIESSEQPVSQPLSNSYNAGSWSTHHLPDSSHITGTDVRRNIEDFSISLAEQTHTSKCSSVGMNILDHHIPKVINDSNGADEENFTLNESDHLTDDSNDRKLETGRISVPDDNSDSRVSLENQDKNFLNADSDHEDIYVDTEDIYVDTEPTYTVIKTEPAEEEKTRHCETTQSLVPGEECMQSAPVHLIPDETDVSANCGKTAPQSSIYSEIFCAENPRLIYNHLRKRPNQKFDCLKCGKSFKTRQNLKVHDRRHLGIRPFSCELCGQRFYQKSHLRSHMPRHFGDKPFVCSYCPVKCSTRSSLHLDECTHRELMIDIPNNQSRTPDNMKRKHPEKKFECFKCGKLFKTQQNLQVHYRTHTGVRPYSCEICGKRFYQNSHLRIHFRTHTGEKPYACDSCPQRFYSSSQLRIHKRTHTEEKSHSADSTVKNSSLGSSLVS